MKAMRGEDDSGEPPRPRLTPTKRQKSGVFNVTRGGERRWCPATEVPVAAGGQARTVGVDLCCQARVGPPVQRPTEVMRCVFRRTHIVHVHTLFMSIGT